MNTPVLTASQRIAAFSCSFDPAALTPEDFKACARSWFDTLTVALAGRAEPAAQRAQAYVAALHGITNIGSRADTGRPAASQARLWGSLDDAPLEAAALWNGIAGHVLDFDDVSSPMRGHPSIALWPALLALADARDLPGRRLASAFVVGFELICKLSRAMATRHYARGWHSTSSVGTLGATVACAHLLGLDQAQTVNALGLAVAQTGGTRQNFGSDAKSFQAGICNAAALRAVLLAEQNFDASTDAIDGEFGYLALYANGESLDAAWASLGSLPLELHGSGFEIKQYPMCYATHRAIDGVLALRREHGLTLDRVQTIEVETSAGALTPLIHHRPCTGLQAKFSMQYALAAALADGTVRLASFDDAAVRRPEIVAFMPRVRAREAANGALLPRYARLALRLKDGTVLERRVLSQHGSAEDPLSDDELVAKGADCLARADARVGAAGLFDTAQQMHRLPARALLDALTC